MAKDKIIPPSLQPRKRDKKPIPKVQLVPKKIEAKPKETVLQKIKKSATKNDTTAEIDKKRFTLWLSPDVYRAFKIHTATRDGSSSDYLEFLIRKDLKLK